MVAKDGGRSTKDGNGDDNSLEEEVKRKSSRLCLDFFVSGLHWEVLLSPLPHLTLPRNVLVDLARAASLS